MGIDLDRQMAWYGNVPYGWPQKLWGYSLKHRPETYGTSNESVPESWPLITAVLKESLNPSATVDEPGDLSKMLRRNMETQWKINGG